jgi:hypothetical protein
MRKKLSAVSILFLIAFTTTAQETVTNDSLIINSDATTHWWTGIINDGNKMPLKDSYHTDFSSNYGNQAQPLLLSDKGGYMV